MRALLCFMTFAILVATTSPADAAGCKDRRGRPRVKVRAKTPLRRGPGLNYGVARFLEKARCAPFSEVSIDEKWVLVELDRSFGWVPVARLTKLSRKKLARTGTTGPVGSGQARGTARLFRQSVLLERPDAESPVRRVLPEGLRVLPLAVTREGDWIQVRDERGDIGWVKSADLVGDSLARLPQTDAPRLRRRGDDEPAPIRSRRQRARRRARSVIAADGSGGGSAGTTVARVPAPRAGVDGFRLRVAVFGAALNPLHSLDSNGVQGIRRYDLTAVSPGAALEVEALNVGPLDLRLGYTIAFMSGVGDDDQPGLGEAGGMQHDASLRIGLPLSIGSVLLTPEIGYHFGMFDFDTVLAGQDDVVFLSTQSHVGTAGLRLQVGLLDGVLLDGDVSALVGVTQESPEELGDAALTLGAVASLGVRWSLSDRYSLIVRYAVNYRTTSYSGAAELDPTITEATLVDLAHGALAGVAIDL